jgi:hypothetical protein
MTLIAQKSELQLDNASLEELVEDLKEERDQILDAKEALHDRIEEQEEEIELLSRSAQDMVELQLARRPTPAGGEPAAPVAVGRRRQDTASKGVFGGIFSKKSSND